MTRTIISVVLAITLSSCAFLEDLSDLNNNILCKEGDWIIKIGGPNTWGTIEFEGKKHNVSFDRRSMGYPPMYFLSGELKDGREVTARLGAGQCFASGNDDYVSYKCSLNLPDGSVRESCCKSGQKIGESDFSSKVKSALGDIETEK